MGSSIAVLHLGREGEGSMYMDTGMMAGWSGGGWGGGENEGWGGEIWGVGGAIRE
jgi:hypothetical protein